jgi:branched-chain amino acid transport system substrate-binding protein
VLPGRGPWPIVQLVRIARPTLLAVAVGLAGLAAGGSRGETQQITPLPQSFCSAVVSGRDAPQVLVVSDLPVRAFPSHRDTVQMQAAIEFVLRRHGFRAGRTAVGYQACDDSNPQRSSGDLTKCAANAKAYAQDASVVGVIGTWSSSCAAVEIPILDRAPGGPLGLISPSNTAVGLTHAAAGTDPGEPGRYYPGGKRNFVRVISPDDAQARADALLASRVGVRAVFVLNDGTGYGLDVAGAFEAAARKLGISVAGTAAWHPLQTSFAGLGRRVRASGAGGVFLGGFACDRCPALIRQLRLAVGPKGTLIAPDGFTSVDDLAKAVGAASEGMYVSIPGLTLARLSPLGKEIARRFGPYRLGSGGPAYAAQAAEILLDAIARSDRSRASVTRNLLAARVRNGILGSFHFDRNGDSTFNPAIVVRVSGGRGRVDRVVVAPPA